jgi:murein DD-endopeptidase MepM/ murein hydrolase activator NlpD
MFKENYYKKINTFKISSDFGDLRKYGKHRGKDYTSNLFKKQDVYNLIAGNVYEFGGTDKFHPEDRFAGKFVKIRHNLKYMNGVDCVFFSMYKHLSKINNSVIRNARQKLKKNLIHPGEILGKMGNTGYSKTREGEEWRFVTDMEKQNFECKKGVHLHLEFYTYGTKLLNELRQLKHLIDFDVYDFVIKNGKYYINPDSIIKYCEYLLTKL